MPIKHWPPSERPREKLLSKGPQALSEAELLAIFLRTGVKGKTALDLAREPLSSYGGLRALLEAERESVCRFRGLGDAKYAELQAALELCRRYLGAKLSRSGVLSNPNETRSFLAASLRGYPHEVFACLFLDNRHRVFSFEELFRGTIDGATVHPREVVKRALANNAAAIIFANNHPSGVSEPSQADVSLTRRRRDALSLVDIWVLDHFVIGDDAAVSLAEKGLL